jgi:acyl-CoA thioester hydrolase
MNRPTREQFRFFTPILTRWGDVDRIGHINNAKYITYDEQARTEYFGARLAQPLDGSQASVILARITCNYLEQLHHPEIGRAHV